VDAEKSSCVSTLGGLLEAIETPAKFDEKLFTMRL
jgi:hypothetical protein